jgi:hypothetical protein
MHKIRDLTARDRSRIYEIMQQDDILSAMEIDTTLEQIDKFLFEKEKTKNKAIVIENEKNRVIGFGYYGPYTSIKKSYVIYRFFISSLYDDNSAANELINYIENDIKSLKNKKLFIAMSSKTGSRMLQFYKNHNYLKQERVKNFYRNGKDLMLLEKEIDSNTIKKVYR